MARIEVTKSVFGKLQVGYDCSHCGEHLKSPLTDAGKIDFCPNCRAQFAVPGTDELNREKERQLTESQRKKAEAEQNAEALKEEHSTKRQQQRVLAEAKAMAEEKARQRAQKERERKQNEQLSAKPSEPPPGPSSPKRKRGPSLVLVGAVAVAVAVILIAVVYSVSSKSGAGLSNALRSSDLRSKLKTCESYGIVKADVYYDGLVSTDTVVFDFVDGGSATARRIDLVHLLLQFADKVDLYSVNRIVLARNGKEKFYISATDLLPLASSYANGGRIWSFNHLPEKVRSMSGFQPYGEWSGGMLAVVQKQAEDLDDFITKWTSY